MNFNHRQFVISSAANADAPSLGAELHFTALRATHDPLLNRVTFVDDRGEDVATAIGYPCLPEQGFPGNGARVMLDFACRDSRDLEVHLLGKLAGTYILVSHVGPHPRLYTDAGATMPVVYDAAARMAALAPDLLLDAPARERRFDHALHAASITSEGHGGWILGDNTAFSGIRRLLPNHALDLVTWQAARFWPRGPGDVAFTTPEAALAAIIPAMRKFCTASATAFPVHLALTAGADSRFVLAACRDVRERIRTFTIRLASSHAQRDCIVAQKIARMAGVEHDIIPILDATPAEQAAWDRAVGHSVREYNRVQHPTLTRLPDDAVIFTGTGGEVGRCYFYHRDALRIRDRAIDVDALAARIKMPRTGASDAALERWLAPIAALPPGVILDLAYWELRVGGWGGSQMAAQNAIRLHLAPLLQHAVLRAFVRVPPEEKAGDRLYLRGIRAMWPDLMHQPLNHVGGWRDLLIDLSKYTSPVRIRRHMRKILPGMHKSAVPRKDGAREPPPVTPAEGADHGVSDR